MNLWVIFPESLLNINGILWLPYLTFLFYCYAAYSLIKYSVFRLHLTVFFALTLIASLIMFLSMGPRIGTIIPPLLLLMVMLFPLIILVTSVLKKDSKSIVLWSITTAAGWLHSVSWAVWLFALARS